MPIITQRLNRFFLKLISKLMLNLEEHLDVGYLGCSGIHLDHAEERVRINGRARLTTWIDAVYALRYHDGEVLSAIRLLERERHSTLSALAVIEHEMSSRGVKVCPDCREEESFGRTQLTKGSGDYMYDGGWHDCTTCQGEGVVVDKSRPRANRLQGVVAIQDSTPLAQRLSQGKV